MSWLQWLRKLYSLDTLDTRFITSSSTAPRIDRDGSASAATSEPAQSCQRPLWKTAEFYVYYLVFIVVVPLMFKMPMDVSKSSHPNYSKFSGLLEDGWIPGRKVDNSDSQYSSFRDNVPYLVALLILHPILRFLYDYFWRADLYTKVRPTSDRPSNLTQGLSSAAAADARLEQRISFDVLFALVLMIALHGFSAAKIIVILYLNYSLAKSLPKKYVTVATWAFNIGILFANELSRGYPYARITKLLFPDSLAWVGEWLDHHGGLIPRWEVLFNITVLRLISFNLDYIWSFKVSRASTIEKQLDPANLSDRDRTNMPAKPEDYSFRNYIAYALYSPLYLAGPILTFNDFISQLRYRLPSISTERTILYAIRFFIIFLTMELVLHFIYAVAIFKAQPDWDSYTPFQLSMLGFFNLHIIWLKLLIPWRFFRLWALLDGIDPPENMVRCMSNNYSALAFWRGWHRSYNRWIVRYIYVPLGGSSAKGTLGKLRTIANYLLVFMFVALWHDINLQLLAWGWLATLFVIPEVIGMLLFPAKEWTHRPDAYRWICGAGAIGNILMMMAASIVGFAGGMDGLKGLVHGIFNSSSGLVFFVAACSCLFVGAQVMFEVREEERRQGIKMKC